MNTFLQESLELARRVVASPFTEFAGNAWSGLTDLLAFFVALALSALVLATFPVSLPGLVWLDRRNKRLADAKRDEFSRRFRAELHKNGIDLE